MGLSTALAAGLGAALVQYQVAERLGRGAWKSAAAFDASFGPYRASAVPVVGGARAPAVVRAAGLACILVGELAVPAIVVGSPWALAAGGVWALGYGLLLRPFRGAPRARPTPPQLPRWLVRLLRRKRRRASLG